MKRNRLIKSLLLTTALTASVFANTAVFAEAPEGQYRSELTNEWISTEIKSQRPVAIMVDNESIALDHFGVNSADVVYEIMNSTENGRITRLMCVVKDWRNLQQFGSIRSVRPTNFMLAAEYNAILVHDGGPYFIDEYVAKDYSNNLSGGFARFSNGKSAEFTEYVTSENYTNPTTGNSFAGLVSRIDNTHYSTNYNEYYPGLHFEFSDEEFSLSDYADVQDAVNVSIPFPHNSSTLTYNSEKGTYDYSEYGKPHIDALTNEVTTFKNAIIENCDFTQLDEHGYMVYNVLTSTVHNGYYLTNGKAIPITWEKETETGLTMYFNASTGEPIKLNTGKTYIALVPSDSWSQLSLQ